MRNHQELSQCENMMYADGNLHDLGFIQKPRTKTLFRDFNQSILYLTLLYDEISRAWRALKT
jgi:hypothetical protein